MQLINNFQSALSETIEAIEELSKDKDRVIIAIDGRCASGKTTFAKKLSEMLSANLFHMDDFFLRAEQRTSQRLSTPGENVDHERFLSDVLLPLVKGESFSYRPFDCHAMDFAPAISVMQNKYNIIEGSYSCHPKLRDYYDLCVFFDVDASTQLERIKERNGVEKAQIFRDRWIPLEEMYFRDYNVKDKCRLHFEL